MPHLKVVPASQAEYALDAPVRVGKDILALLSTAMYKEPLSIVREYVQNAADSIDVAYEADLLGPKAPGRIDIALDDSDRSLVIRDNGTGIAKDTVEEVLVAFGLSPKRGTTARGFRGVGRLGGLGFAQQVRFRTRFQGEAEVTEISWDCRALRAILLDSKERADIGDVVRRIVTVSRRDDPKAPDHFFEVTLNGVVRLRNDRLLNPSIVESYLAQVAPVPFNPEMKFTSGITTFLDEFMPRRRMDVRVNGSEPLTRPHRTAFAVSGLKRDRFKEVQFLKLPGREGGVAAVGWILHHNYLGAIQASPEIRGLRARAGDIQIGEDSLFADVFPEERFSGWVVGEINILDPAIAPNGRRDDFETTLGYSHLLNQLLPIGRDLARRCRSSSLERAGLRSFELHEASVLTLAEQIRKRRYTGRRARSALAEAKAAIAEMKRILPRCSTKKRELDELHGRIRSCQVILGKSHAAAQDTNDPFTGVPTAKRAAFEEFVKALYGCLPNRRSTEKLVDKIVRWIVRRSE